MSLKKVTLVIGTRPEAIKLAPLALELGRRREAIQVELLFSGQHPHLVTPILTFFGLSADATLETMVPGQTLGALTSRAMAVFDRRLSEHRPDLIVVQGDTTTAMCAALSAFYHKIPIAHLEAGLRTHNLHSPFPEEANRRIISQLAQLHWAPTQQALEALRAEKPPVAPEAMVVMGNTGIDALLLGVARVRKHHPEDETCAAVETHRKRAQAGAFVLITGHRRENFGTPFAEFCEGLHLCASRHPEALFVYPVHPNPNVKGPVETLLAGLPNLILTEPKNYPEFLWLLDQSDLVVTDSGGVQEEAPALGKPVLVTRSTTERPEGIATGHVRLVGPGKEGLVPALSQLLLEHRQAGHCRLTPAFPYGDGKAAQRCAASILGETFAPFGG